MANNLIGKTISKRYIVEEILGQGECLPYIKARTPI